MGRGSGGWVRWSFSCRLDDCGGGGTCGCCPSQELVLPQVHPLNDVPTVTEDTADVFRVHRAGEVGVTVMPSVTTGCADSLQRTQK